ncbi:ABC-2 type transporter-domain-containing protein [Haematococcus lacustris]
MAAHTLERRPGAWHQGAVLFCRTATDMWRNPSLLLMHVLLALVTGVVVGVIFLHQPFTLSGVQNRAGVLFFSLALTGFTALSVFDGLMLDRALVTREARAGHYHPAAYLVGRLALDALLLRAVPATLFTLVLYPLAGLKTDAANVATLALVLGTFGATVGALAVCMAGLVDTPGKATLLMNLVLLLWVLLGGFLVNPTSIPPGIGWLRYCSPMPYAFEALVSNEVAGQTFSLSVPGIPSVDNIQGYALMTAIGLDASRAQSDVALLVVFFMGFNALAMAAFSWAAA